MKDLLRIADLSLRDLVHLLDTADTFRDAPHARRGLLTGDTVITYFAKPSTRTRLSFGTAISRLGGVPEVVRPDELQLGRGETIEDTARVVSRYARAFVIRTFADDDVRRFAAAASIPVVNALTDGHHPCQALADLLTLRAALRGAHRPPGRLCGRRQQRGPQPHGGVRARRGRLHGRDPAGLRTRSRRRGHGGAAGRRVRRAGAHHPRPDQGGRGRRRRVHGCVALDGRRRRRKGPHAPRRLAPYQVNEGADGERRPRPPSSCTACPPTGARR